MEFIPKSDIAIVQGFIPWTYVRDEGGAWSSINGDGVTNEQILQEMMHNGGILGYTTQHGDEIAMVVNRRDAWIAIMWEKMLTKISNLKKRFISEEC